MKCELIDRSILSGLKQPILFSLVLNEPSGFTVFCESETNRYKRYNKSFSNTIAFYLEDDIHEEGNFNGETLTFALKISKIETIKRAFKSLKVILIVLEEDIDLLQQKVMEILPLKVVKY